MAVAHTDVVQIILDSLRDFMAEKKLDVPDTLGPDSAFLQGDLPIDSLDLAVLLLILEEKIGHDPFRDGFKAFNTVAELAAIYAEH
jgi:acyl carrier protein